MLFFVNYALMNFRSPNQYTISIDLLSIRISIRIISIRINMQSKHRDQQAKGLRESALSCIKNYALCCTILVDKFQRYLYIKTASLLTSSSFLWLPSSLSFIASVNVIMYNVSNKWKCVFWLTQTPR